MSDNVSHLENPLLEEATYNGRLFHLSLPTTGELNFAWLEDKLEGKPVELEEKTDADDQDNLHIPEVFESGFEDDAHIATIRNVTEFHYEGLNGVIGYLSHNKSDTVKFDNKEVLVLDQQDTKFLIFEFAGQAFLLIITSRDSMGTLFKLLEDVLNDLGFVTDEILIDSDEFDKIANVLIDTHLMTAVEGYEESTINKKHILCRGYGDAEEYKREKRQGSVQGQRFGTSQLDASSKTIQISEDCLIRSYHKITLSMYLAMITSYIIPSLSLTIQTSLNGYSSESSRVTTDKITDD